MRDDETFHHRDRCAISGIGFAGVIVSVVLTSFAYWLVIGHERKRRASEGRTEAP